ncbi:MAG: hypothetical protein GDA51_01315 [Ekhidna sp.]|nr:hypothetical protein [Ekhidna sp.]MBC6410099.1 hypothetical protein [Ekhidna sp.]MBC6425119.1 hypothetical protein [Ekhidna sp.]
MSKWQSVYKDQQEYRVDIVKAILNEVGILSVKINKTVSAHGFGNFEVFVAPDNVLRAIRVIKEEINFE